MASGDLQMGEFGVVPVMYPGLHVNHSEGRPKKIKAEGRVGPVITPDLSNKTQETINLSHRYATWSSFLRDCISNSLHAVLITPRAIWTGDEWDRSCTKTIARWSF